MFWASIRSRTRYPMTYWYQHSNRHEQVSFVRHCYFFIKKDVFLAPAGLLLTPCKTFAQVFSQKFIHESIEICMGFLLIGKHSWGNDDWVEKMSIYIKISPIAKFDFSCCKGSCATEMGNLVHPSRQCCREFISLSTGTNRVSNGWTDTEHGQKYEDHPIFLKNDHSFPHPLSIFPIAPARIVRTDSKFQQQLFRRRAIDWHQNEPILNFSRGVMTANKGGPLADPLLSPSPDLDLPTSGRNKSDILHVLSVPDSSKWPGYWYLLSLRTYP